MGSVSWLYEWDATARWEPYPEWDFLAEPPGVDDRDPELQTAGELAKREAAGESVARKDVPQQPARRRRGTAWVNRW